MKFDNCSELENDLQVAYTEQNTLSPVAENMPFDLPVKKKNRHLWVPQSNNRIHVIATLVPILMLSELHSLISLILLVYS